jgi:hypothetical protein
MLNLEVSNRITAAEASQRSVTPPDPQANPETVRRFLEHCYKAIREDIKRGYGVKYTNVYFGDCDYSTKGEVARVLEEEDGYKVRLVGTLHILISW